MWLEIKAMMTSIGMIFFIIGLFLSNVTIFTLIIGFFGIGIMLFGDIIIGYQITANELKPLMDKTPPGQELTIFQEIGGKLHFINTVKAELGIRKFRWQNKEAAIINDGSGMVTLPNGNRAFFSHESYDKNISMVLCKALEIIAKKTEAKDIKEIYDNAIKEIERLEKEKMKYNV